jgi:hypothetical protein
MERVEEWSAALREAANGRDGSSYSCFLLILVVPRQHKLRKTFHFSDPETYFHSIFNTNRLWNILEIFLEILLNKFMALKNIKSCSKT